jgi:Tfp pilus assembly protein PilX
MIHNKTIAQGGFALLMTLMVVSVVIAITIAIIELSVQQLKLATDARDSEVAFHAANAGMECAQYVRRNASSSFALGTSPITFNCFGASDVVTKLSSTGLDGVDSTRGAVYRYQLTKQWSSGTKTVCSEIDMVVMSANGTTGTLLTVTNLDDEMPGFPINTNKTCQTNGLCTIASVTGYNSTCTGRFAPGVLKRNLLLEF